MCISFHIDKSFIAEEETVNMFFVDNAAMLNPTLIQHFLSFDFKEFTKPDEHKYRRKIKRDFAVFSPLEKITFQI